tara:strand:+ start:1028 stop:1444 length:417 start_codon:yes stop_codon:yes gene_type:complete
MGIFNSKLLNFNKKIIVEIIPQFYILDENSNIKKIKNFKIKKNLTLNKKKKEFLFNYNNLKFKTIKSSFNSNKLIFEIKYKKKDEDITFSDLEYYIEEAWISHCGDGNPLKATFINEKKYKNKQIYFNVLRNNIIVKQ